MNDVIHYYASMPAIEWLAVAFSLLYVIFAARNNMWCWPAAIVSTLLYTFIFYDVYLWMDSVLQVYYLLMALYGWYIWSHYQADKKGITNQNVKPIKSLGLTFNLIAIGILTCLSFIAGWLMDEYTPTDFPYMDSFTTIFAVFATYLVTQKVIENWLYWIVIDFVSIYLYMEKALQPTAALFFIFVIIAIYGYFQWRSILHNEDHALPLRTA